MPRKGQFKDLTGMKFGKLTIVKVDRIEKRHNGGGSHSDVRYWFCTCECGGSTVIRGSHLTGKTEQRASITRSCGCERLKYQHGEKWKERSIRKGTAFRRCLDRYKANAKNRELTWELTEEQFKVLTQSPCYYTGEQPSNVSTARSGEQYVYNGIDRVDNSKGYTLENCVPCCFKINAMKSDMTAQEFYELCTKVSERLKHEFTNL